MVRIRPGEPITTGVRNDIPDPRSFSAAGASANRLGEHLPDDEKQIGVAGLLPGGGQERVCLAAVMRLVIEKMRDEEALWRRDFAVGGAAKPGQVRVEPFVVDLLRPARDIGIGLLAGGAQFRPVLDEMVALFDGRRRALPAVE